MGHTSRPDSLMLRQSRREQLTRLVNPTKTFQGMVATPACAEPTDLSQRVNKLNSPSLGACAWGKRAKRGLAEQLRMDGCLLICEQHSANGPGKDWNMAYTTSYDTLRGTSFSWNDDEPRNRLNRSRRQRPGVGHDKSETFWTAGVCMNAFSKRETNRRILQR